MSHIWSQENIDGTLHYTKYVEIHSTEKCVKHWVHIRELNSSSQYIPVFYFCISVTNTELLGSKELSDI
jgi:hypothetical protein